MSAILHTSTQFACVTADGADWRDVGRQVLESIESIRTENDGMTTGFLYTTTELAPDYGSLMSLLKNITRIPDWFGATGAGICGNGISHGARPAATVMIARLPPESFQAFTLPADFSGALPDPLPGWLAGHHPAIALTHGLLCAPGARALGVLREKGGLFTVGGFSSSRSGGVHAASAAIVAEDPVSGIILDDSLQILVASSQG